MDNITEGTFLIPYRVVGKNPALSRLLKKYANVPMDFADACLVDMADEYQTGRILTLDRDFHIYRWGKNRPFEICRRTFDARTMKHELRMPKEARMSE